jgi:glycerol-3-phosphate O-acyltransferase
MRRSFKGDPLYTALFAEYVQRLIVDWSPIEFFIEGTRSRSGKSLHPKFGMVYICTEPFLNKKVPDTTIVPISISYEKVIEAELFTNELLGEQKTKESLEGLIRASKILKVNFGRINVIFNDPISLKDYTAKMTTDLSASKSRAQPFDPYTNMEDRRFFVRELGYRVVHDLNKGLAYTTTALVATVILTYRKGITPQDLVSKVDWLREEVHSKGGSIAFEGTSEDLVAEGLKLLSNLITKNRNMFTPALDRHSDKASRSVIVLDFYR